MWTIICLVLVCAVAVALRINLIYKLYPIKYEEEIALYAETYTIDEFFVCAVIYAESHFNAEAVSGKGAVGLMQVMPETGAWAAKKIGIDGFTDDMLNDPGTNIQIGCWYLNYLTNMFDGDARLVLAAYNAGPSNAREWITEDGELDVQFDETKDYLEKVQRYYEIYRGLYKEF